MIEYIIIGLVALELLYMFRGKIFTYDDEKTPDCDDPYTKEMICSECGWRQSGKVHVLGQNKHEYKVRCTNCKHTAKTPKSIIHRIILWYKYD